LIYNWFELYCLILLFKILNSSVSLMDEDYNKSYQSNFLQKLILKVIKSINLIISILITNKWEYEYLS